MIFCLFVCFLQVGKRNQMQQNYLILSQLGTKHLQNVCTPVFPTYPAIFLKDEVEKQKRSSHSVLIFKLWPKRQTLPTAWTSWNPQNSGIVKCWYVLPGPKPNTQKQYFHRGFAGKPWYDEACWSNLLGSNDWQQQLWS